MVPINKMTNIQPIANRDTDGLETNVTAEIANEPVTHVTSGLTNGTKYNFTLFTVSENVRSSGVSISAFTAPPNAEDFKSVGQNETSVTLQWKKVENILTYVLVSSDGLETNVTAEIANEPVTHVTSGLTNGTRYNFTLFTVSENVRSSGVSISSFTAPRNAEDFKAVGQNETSVTLHWKKVENILTYVLVSSDGLDTNVTAVMGNEPLRHVTSGLTNGTRYNFTLFTVSANVRSSGVSISAFTGLTNGTKYNFTLFTVSENVRSSGVSISAFTAPPNAEDFKSVGQNETSITLQWKKVENILTYVLVSSDGLETNVTAEIANEPVTHVTSGLTNGTKYNFTLFTVSEKVRSSGVSISAFTAPPNAEEFKSVEQNETSVTLQWKKVENILTYVLVSSDGLDTNVTAEIGNEPVTHVTSGLTNGTKYNFTLFTVSAKVRSSGVSISA
ncbi:receptor-type tyrosine-protein phosphatase H-like, partial [Platichthys flesus]|uniref:receptor-type tyrosine-protein phosphatase H-like n=1 Tax=Platichthys flesus TaxID=8260 RepID=UPI002DBD5FEE